MTKVCSKCKLPKPEEQFWLSTKASGKRRSWCIDCSNVYEQANKDRARARMKRYREKHKEEIKLRSRQRRANNLEKYKKQERAAYQRNKDRMRERRREKEYKISVEQFDTLFDVQNKSCAICKTQNPGSRNWHVDHCHSSDKVRGILCQNCNLAIGLMKDDPSRIRVAAFYLENPPAYSL